MSDKSRFRSGGVQSDIDALDTKVDNIAPTGYLRTGDVNNLPDNSFYLCYSGVSNLPNTTNIFYVFTRKIGELASTNYMVQIAVNYSNGDVYVRRGIDQGLQPWIKLN